MIVLPPRPTNLSGFSYPNQVGQPEPAAPQPPSSPTPGSAAQLTPQHVRKIIQEELQKNSQNQNGSTEESTPQTGWGAFWTGLWGWLQSASGELITAGATVFITLYARELYAQARVPEKQAAHVALDLATPETEFEKMSVDELETQIDNLSADFFADEPPSNLQLGQRLQLALEVLLAKKLENLEKIDTAIEEAEADGDKAIVQTETERGAALADQIETLQDDWDEVTEHVRDLIETPKALQKFRKKYD